MKKVIKDDPVRLKKLVNDAVKKSVRLEVKQSKKRAERKKKLKKLKKGGLVAKEVVEDDVVDEQPVKEKKVKKRKRKEKTDVSPKAKKPKTGFAVSDVAKDTQVSPVGAKRMNGSSEPMLELPPGWIVESVVQTEKKEPAETVKPLKKPKSPEKKKEEKLVADSDKNGSCDTEQVVNKIKLFLELSLKSLFFR